MLRRPQTREIPRLRRQARSVEEATLTVKGAEVSTVGACRYVWVT